MGKLNFPGFPYCLCPVKAPFLITKKFGFL